MSEITLNTGKGRWAIRPITHDPLARVRDRTLRDLLDDLEAAIALLDDSGDLLVAAKLRREGECIRNALAAAYDYIVELRR